MIPKITKETIEECFSDRKKRRNAIIVFNEDQPELIDFLRADNAERDLVGGMVVYHELLTIQQAKQKEFIGYSEDGKEVWY